MISPLSGFSPEFFIPAQSNEGQLAVTHKKNSGHTLWFVSWQIDGAGSRFTPDFA